MEEYRRPHNEGDVQALPPLCRPCVYSTQIELYGRINSTIRELLSDEERDRQAVNEQIYDFVIGLTTAQVA